MITPRTTPSRQRALVLFASAVTIGLASPAAPQAQESSAAPSTGRRPTRPVVMDSARAQRLYVSNRPEDHPVGDFDAQIRGKARTDSIYRAHAAGNYDFQRVRYRSRADGMEIPAYVFQPLQRRGARGHASMIWVHGGVHGDWGVVYLPFVKEAVQRGYVIVAPEYRGSTGYGQQHYLAIDYGGKEVDDVISAHDYIRQSLPHVDPERVGMMGWSHGGFITAHSLFRDQHPFKAGAAIVPVTNLIHRLGRKGPGYQRSFATQQGIQGLPFEKPEEYIKRSPLFHVDKLRVPILVHVATNDTDVNFDEDVQLVYALRSQKSDLAETKVYVDPAPWGNSGGHAFSRRVDLQTLQRVDSPEQIDSWNRTWVFFEWVLRPYEDRSRPRADDR
ncbi:MAG: prolyl oligopeptidase family serine peptidase [Actinomycetota bacterium]|nr:prolyl oligopeptidase family serine peptidase [Actinomycetota bacterium]